jgi:glutamyl/glutaminyl-tRNA synthetase
MRVKIGGQKYAKAKYDRTCLELPKEVVEERKAKGESFIVRMKVPHGKTQFKDIVHGKVIFDNNTIDD